MYVGRYTLYFRITTMWKYFIYENLIRKKKRYFTIKTFIGPY